MATYNSFDPRKDIRTVIGTAWWNEEEGSISVVTVTDANSELVRVPLRMAEETKTESLDEMPYIEMSLAYVDYNEWDIGAETRQREAYIDCHLYFTDTDNIDSTSFGNDVISQMHELVRSAQCTFGTTYKMFVNINEVRYIREERAHQVVFHYVLTIYAIHYDQCST